MIIKKFPRWFYILKGTAVKNNGKSFIQIGKLEKAHIDMSFITCIIMEQLFRTPIMKYKTIEIILKETMPLCGYFM